MLRAVNVQGTDNLIQTIVNSNVQKVVCWSSVALYGDADPKWYKMPITENQELNPKIFINFSFISTIRAIINSF